VAHLQIASLALSSRETQVVLVISLASLASLPLAFQAQPAGNFGTVTGVSGVFTAQVSGATVTGNVGIFTRITGISGAFTAQLSGQNVFGENATFNYITGSTRVEGGTVSGVTVTGNTGLFGNLTAATGNFTSRVSGAYITGATIEAVTVNAITGNFTVANFTQTTTGNIQASGSGIFGSGVFTSGIVSGGIYYASGGVVVISGPGDVRPYGLYSFPNSLGISGYILSTNANGTTSWLPAPGKEENVVVVSGNVTTSGNTYYVLISGASLTLPGTPVSGNYVGIINRSSTTTGLILRNGSNIMGVADDLQIDDLNARFRLIYADSSQGWVID